MMLHPRLAQDIYQALVAYRQRLLANGYTVADGYDQYVAVIAAAASADDPDTASPWLTLDQAAARAHASPRTVRRWRSQGLATSNVGRRVLVHRDDLDAFLKGDRTQAANFEDIGGQTAA